MLSSLVCLGRHTITGLLHAAGGSFQDWSALYRVFSQSRLDSEALFAAVRRGVVAQLRPGEPLVVALDDSLRPKRGTKTPGVAWRRDPLGPPFQTNLIRAQRVLEISAAVPGGADRQAARLIPLDFQHAPTPPKPRKNASAQQRRQYREASRKASLARRGAARLHQLRQNLDQQPDTDRRLEVVVDGRFTNCVLLKNLPPRTVLIGCLRQDAKLYQLPSVRGAATGRRRCYGQRAPTPEQLRQDDGVPWERVTAYAAGQLHAFRIKTLAPVRWRPAGGQANLRLVVIAPLGYRPRKGSRLLYRRPAYLIATDTAMSPQQIVQHYLWRWDIEVNFRDQKTLLGVGQAQVRHPRSVEAVPQLLVAAYAGLLLAARQAYGPAGFPDALPPPKWRQALETPPLDARSNPTTARRTLGGTAYDVSPASPPPPNHTTSLRNSVARFPPPCFMLPLEPFASSASASNLLSNRPNSSRRLRRTHRCQRTSRRAFVVLARSRCEAFLDGRQTITPCRSGAAAAHAQAKAG